MIQRSLLPLCRGFLLLAVIACSGDILQAQGLARFVLSCSPDNDLYVVMRTMGISCERYDTPEAALANAAPGYGVLILADRYPDSTTRVSSDIVEIASGKKVRLYMEYPSWLPGGPTALPRDARVERAVIGSGFFGPELPPLRILSVNGLRFIPVGAEKSHLVAARVAGFDSALYGLPKEVYPLLFELPSADGVLIGATKLSGFVKGRYTPTDAWRAVWHGILSWLVHGTPLPALRWVPTVRPSFSAAEPLPAGAERDAFARGAEWFWKSKLLLPPSRQAEARAAIERGALLPAPPPGAVIGDGTLGIMEAILSVIQRDGSQLQSPVLRGDCNGEAAMALAFGGTLLHVPGKNVVAKNLLDHWYFVSDARKGARGNADSAAYGLIAWGVSSPAWYKANYGDDNARLMLGTLAAASLMKNDRWDEAVMRCMLANLRTSGRLGFRGDRIDLEDLSGHQWREFFNRDTINYSPHMESYLWACYLWAFHKTGDSLFFQRAESALRMTMAQYPSGWRWMNGLAQERARILLPLAWLVRVSDTPEHRQWLRKAVDGLLTLQMPCGAIREELGEPNKGVMPPPGSNDEYGGSEASLIQQNGDPVSDQLYTTNFAFLGLHEAAAAGDTASMKAEKLLAGYFCRIQVRSEVHPSLDGGWFRAFDFKRWEPWGSNADAGWGAWAIESGWTQGWITSVFGLRIMKSSLWDLTSGSQVNRGYAQLRQEMLSQ